MTFQTSELSHRFVWQFRQIAEHVHVKPLTIHTIMKDYSDKLKSWLIECTKNLVQRLTSELISVVWMPLHLRGKLNSPGGAWTLNPLIQKPLLYQLRHQDYVNYVPIHKMEIKLNSSLIEWWMNFFVWMPFLDCTMNLFVWIDSYIVLWMFIVHSTNQFRLK